MCIFALWHDDIKSSSNSELIIWALASIWSTYEAHILKSAEMINHLISWSVDSKLITVVKQKCQTFIWFQLLKCEDLLLFSVFYHCKFDILFLSPGLTEQSSLKTPCLALHLRFFLTFRRSKQLICRFEKIINRWINNKNKIILSCIAALFYTHLRQFQ